MKIIASPLEMREWSRSIHANQERITLVPTMGFLHQGHLALVERARNLGEKVVVSIFVNPTQFGPNEDLQSYPQDLESDLAKLKEAGVDVVFTPTRESIYGSHFNSYVVPTHLSENLCGATRPGHFRGVCTVVLLLFRITLCDHAVFGEKDYQQLQILRQMTTDLWLDVQITGVPIVREADGLAMSSRNVYLSGEERQSALTLHRALDQVGHLLQGGERSVNTLKEAAKELINSAPHTRIDYLNFVDSTDLALLSSTVNAPFTCAMAVFVGSTRLIDNRSFSPTTS